MHQADGGAENTCPLDGVFVRLLHLGDGQALEGGAVRSDRGVGVATYRGRVVPFEVGEHAVCTCAPSVTVGPPLSIVAVGLHFEYWELYFFFGCLRLAFTLCFFVYLGTATIIAVLQ